jgi:hypothetical protein
MDINLFAKAPNDPTDAIIAVVNGLAGSAAALVAIVALIDGMRHRAKLRRQGLEFASLGIMQALEIVKVMLKSMDDAPPQSELNVGFVLGMMEQARTAIGAVFGREIADPGLQHLALNVQTLTGALENDAAQFKSAARRPTTGAYLNGIEGLRTSTPEMINRLYELRTALKLANPKPPVN